MSSNKQRQQEKHHEDNRNLQEQQAADCCTENPLPPRPGMRQNAQSFLEQFGVPRWLVSGGLTSLMALLWGIGIVGALWLFNFSSMISVPLLLAAVVAVVVYPLVKMGDRIKLPRILSSVLVILLLMGVAYGTVHITFAGVINQEPAIGSQLSSGANDLLKLTRDGLINVGIPEETITNYIYQIEESITDFIPSTPSDVIPHSEGGVGTGGNAGIDDAHSSDPTDTAGIPLSTESTHVVVTSDGTTATVGSLLKEAELGSAAGGATGVGIGDIGTGILQGVNTIGGFLSGLAGGLFSVFIFLVFLFYFLSDFDRIRDWISNNFFRDKRLGRSIINDITYSLSGYFRATTLTAIIVSIAIGIPLWIMGVPLIIPIIIVTVLTTYVPFLGALIASAFTVLIALAAGGIYYALIAIVIMLIANNVLQTFVSNKLMGDYLNLHPLAVLIATLFGTVALGLLGGALGAPFLAIAIAIMHRVRKFERGELSDADLEERVHDNGGFASLFGPLKKWLQREKAAA